MQHCVVCTGEMTNGFVDEDTGNTWCDEICLRVDYTAQEQKAAYNENGGGLYWTSWETEEPCDRCGGAERVEGNGYCDECIEDTQMAIAGFQQLELEIGRVKAE